RAVAVRPARPRGAAGEPDHQGGERLRRPRRRVGGPEPVGRGAGAAARRERGGVRPGRGGGDGGRGRPAAAALAAPRARYARSAGTGRNAVCCGLPTDHALRTDGIRGTVRHAGRIYGGDSPIVIGGVSMAEVRAEMVANVAKILVSE